MNFTQRVQAAVSAIQGKTTAVIDADEHLALLDSIDQLGGEKQRLVDQRDAAIRERDIALNALEGLAGTRAEADEAPADEEAAEEDLGQAAEE